MYFYESRQVDVLPFVDRNERFSIARACNLNSITYFRQVIGTRKFSPKQTHCFVVIPYEETWYKTGLVILLLIIISEEIDSKKNKSSLQIVYVLLISIGFVLVDAFLLRRLIDIEQIFLSINLNYILSRYSFVTPYQMSITFIHTVAYLVDVWMNLIEICLYETSERIHRTYGLLAMIENVIIFELIGLEACW